MLVLILVGKNTSINVVFSLSHLLIFRVKALYFYTMHTLLYFHSLIILNSMEKHIFIKFQKSSPRCRIICEQVNEKTKDLKFLSSSQSSLFPCIEVIQFMTIILFSKGAIIYMENKPNLAANQQKIFK